MQLNTLPVDGLRLILFYVHVDDLTRLFCAFDRRIMKVMSFPGALPYLQLEPAAIRVPRAPLRYLVSCIRNVTHLSLVCVKWAPQSLSLLLALNPIRLDIDDSILHESSLRLLCDIARDPSNTELRSQALFLESNGLPDFSRLTTRLETLTFNMTRESNGTRRCRSGSLPATITSLGGMMNYDVSTLPTGLRSLSLGNDVVQLDEVFARLSRLDTLELVGNSTLLFDDVAVFPRTLTSLMGRSIGPSADALLGFPALRDSSVSTFRLLSTNDLGIFQRVTCREPLANLPSNVTRLELALHSLRTWPPAPSLPGSPPPPYTWPLTLVSLNLALNFAFQPITGLSELSVLEELTLTGPFIVSSKANPIIKSDRLFLDTLPPRLKSVQIECAIFKPLSKFTSITPKLSLLTSLIANDFPLSELHQFRTLAPRCRVYYETSTDASSDVLVSKMKADGLSPNPYLVAFSQLSTAFTTPEELVAEITTRCECKHNMQDEIKVGHSNRIYVTTRLIRMDLNSMSTECSTLHMCSEPTSIEWRSLKPSKFVATLPHALTALELSSCVGTVILQSLPATLTSLTSTVTVTVSNDAGNRNLDEQKEWPFVQLRRLDTPNWTFMASQLGDLHELEVFKANIIDLADYNVIDLLTTAVSPKTRRNMKIGITYYITGAVVPDGEVDGMKCVTWSSICASTFEILKTALAAPMPDVCPSSRSVDDTVQVVHDMSFDVRATVGSVLKSSFQKPSTLICLPSSATTVILQLAQVARLSPNWKHATVQPNGLRPQASDKTDWSVLKVHFPPDDGLVFSRSNLLVRLTLSGLQVENEWIRELPSSLRFLHIAHSPKGQLFTDPLPPKLEVLLLEALNARSLESTPVTIALSILPPTLRKLALAIPFQLHHDAPLTEIELPCLKSVLLRCERKVALEMWNLLSKNAPVPRQFEVLGHPDPMIEATCPGLKLVPWLNLTDILRDNGEQIEGHPIELSCPSAIADVSQMCSESQEPTVEPAEHALVSEKPLSLSMPLSSPLATPMLAAPSSSGSSDANDTIESPHSGATVRRRAVKRRRA